MAANSSRITGAQEIQESKSDTGRSTETSENNGTNKEQINSEGSGLESS